MSSASHREQSKCLVEVCLVRVHPSEGQAEPMKLIQIATNDTTQPQQLWMSCTNPITAGGFDINWVCGVWFSLKL